jgi:NhaC family Na+:H+ antiporter
MLMKRRASPRSRASDPRNFPRPLAAKAWFHQCENEAVSMQARKRPPAMTTDEETTMSETSEPRAPTLVEAIISLLSLVVGIGVSIAIFGMDPHIPMLFGVFVASIVALRCGFSWATVQEGMVQGITNALPAMIILMIVGILIGLWILAGVVPTLIYYGLWLLSPAIFLPTALIICAITSLATGTSWGTTGTIGVALMGVGAGLGLPLPLVAGAVLSGAYLGDKMSPLSDTTNLAPAMVGTDLYTHIGHMMYTTGVAFGLTLVIEIVISMGYAADAGDLARIEQIMATSSRPSPSTRCS